MKRPEKKMKDIEALLEKVGEEPELDFLEELELEETEETQQLVQEAKYLNKRLKKA